MKQRRWDVSVGYYVCKTCRLIYETCPPSFKHRKKYEIATDEEFTPIKQDTKKGKLREVRDYCICYINLQNSWDFFSFDDDSSHLWYFLSRYSLRRVISFSTMGAFLKLGKILPSSILMLKVAEVTMILWMYAKLAPELWGAV